MPWPIGTCAAWSVPRLRRGGQFWVTEDHIDLSDHEALFWTVRAAIWLSAVGQWVVVAF